MWVLIHQTSSTAVSVNLDTITLTILNSPRRFIVGAARCGLFATTPSQWRQSTSAAHPFHKHTWMRTLATAAPTTEYERNSSKAQVHSKVEFTRKWPASSKGPSKMRFPNAFSARKTCTRSLGKLKHSSMREPCLSYQRNQLLFATFNRLFTTSCKPQRSTSTGIWCTTLRMDTWRNYTRYAYRGLESHSQSRLKFAKKMDSWVSYNSSWELHFETQESADLTAVF